MRLRLLAILFLAIFFSVFAHATQTLKIGLTQFPASIHPHFSPMLAKNFILGMALRPVTSFNANWEYSCLVCSKLPRFGTDDIKLIDQEKELYEVTYHIKENLFWGDGKQVTVDDILFTWEMGKNPNNGFINHTLYRDEIVDIKAVDDFSFKVIRKKSELSLIDLNDFWIMPNHMEAQLKELHDHTYKDRSLYTQTPELAGLYFGPYVITKYIQGQAVFLKKNPYWKGQKLFFDEIEIIKFKSGFTLEAAILTGEISMVGVPGISIHNVQNLRSQKLFYKTHKILDRSSLTLELLMPNFENKFLQNKKIRQALFMALDRKSITKAIFGDYGKIASSFLNELDPIYVKPDVLLKYDSTESLRLLQEAGLILDPRKKIWKDKDGKEFRVNIISTAGHEIRKRYLDYCKKVWEDMGIKTQLQFVPPRIFFGDVLKHRKFKDFALVGWPTTPGFIPVNTFGSHAIPDKENAFVGYNYMGYKSQKMDDVLNQLTYSIDVKQDTKTLREFQNLVNEDLPVLPLYYKDRFYVVPKEFEGLRPTGNLFPASFWVEGWHLSGS